MRHPIIVEFPETRKIVELALKRFGIEINKETHIFVCPQKVCELDEQVKISTNNPNDPELEHFVCLFFIQKKHGFIPIFSSEKIQEFVKNTTWENSSETLGDMFPRLHGKPEFVVTFGRMCMANGVKQNTSWCIHELLWDDKGIFDATENDTEVFKKFESYLCSLPIKTSKPLIKIQMCNHQNELPEPEEKNEDEQVEPVDDGEVFRMESAILQVVSKIGFRKQKGLIKLFCQGNEKINILPGKISSWKKVDVKYFILQNDVLNYFEIYREEIATAMTGMMPNEGIVENIEVEE